MFVLDASALIYLAKLKLLEKLGGVGKFYLTENVFREVIKTDNVESEYIKKFAEGRVRSPIADLFFAVVGLSKADSGSISLAKELSCIAIIDEKRGREVATLSAIENHGTIYLLFLMLEKNIITKYQFRIFLDRLILEGFYLSPLVYSEVLKKLEKY